MGMALLIIVILYPLFSRFFNPIPGFSWRNIRINICISTFQLISFGFCFPHFGVTVNWLDCNSSMGLHSQPSLRICHARAHAWSKPCLPLRSPCLVLFGNQPPGKNQFRLGAPKSNRTTEESVYFYVFFVFGFGPFCWEKDQNGIQQNSKTSPWQCCAMLHKCLRMAFPPHDPDKTWMFFDHCLWRKLVELECLFLTTNSWPPITQTFSFLQLVVVSMFLYVFFVYSTQITSIPLNELMLP